MTAKEYLEQIGKLEHKIQCMKERAEYYDHMSLSIPGPSYGEKIGSNPNRNLEAPFIKGLIKLDEIKREIVKKEEELKNLKAEALMKIEALDNEDYKNILILRYIKFMEWNDICKKLYISKTTSKRWHDNAFLAIKIEGNIV